MDIVIATSNAHKVAEFQRLLRPSVITFHTAATIGGMPPVEETGTSFMENARLKALALRQAVLRPGPILADDSGLEVDSLNGRPGIHSARYAGPGADDAANRARLLEELSGIPYEDRTARFRCALCLLMPDGSALETTGTVEGWIALAPAGATGFGYDPLFIAESYATTFAQLSPQQKDLVSHRSRALRGLTEKLGLPA
ncbi:MAG: RdgB/HAM1 family non-canonical purine NTP pyrophosphatase [Puniceicoccaceae bacterium]